MATLTIRNLPPDVVERLKDLARRNGRSMEQEAREILGQRLATRSELLSEMQALWTEIATPPSASDIDGWIKEGRQGRKWS